jgi:hypothetical protein
LEAKSSLLLWVASSNNRISFLMPWKNLSSCELLLTSRSLQNRLTTVAAGNASGRQIANSARANNNLYTSVLIKREQTEASEVSMDVFLGLFVTTA